MTISTTTTKNSYSGNGSTTAFNYTFFIPTSTDIQVIVRSSTGTETVKSEGTGSTNYSITGVGNSGGGTVTFVTAPASGETVVLRRNTAKTQATDYVANDPFPAESHESALDKLTIIGQDLQEQVDRSIKLSRTNTMTSTEFTVGSTDRANKILAFDSSGEIQVTQELGTFRGNWAASTVYEVRDLVKDTSTNNIFIATTAHTSSGSQPLTSNTDSAKWSLIVDAASATTSQNAAATSATAAANSATAASNSESAASTSESNAASSATASANSATASASSATSAAASYDNFDDRYLGQKSSDPSVDNDGDALLTGALYFNTSNNVMMVYSGSAWQRTTPTSSDQTNINALSASAVITDMSMLATTDVIADMALLADADVIADMNTLAVTDVINDINLLATSDIVSDLNTLATSDIVSDINTLATSDIVSDLNTLATSDIVSDINTLATSDIVTDLNLLATSDFVADLNLLATSANVTNMAALGTSTNVTNMANLNASGVISNIATTAGSISNINSVGSNISNINTVASNISGVNSFGERYRISSSAPSTSLDIGDLYFDTTADELKVYKSGGWAAAGSTVNGTSDRFKYTATANQTTFTGSDANGNTLAYDSGYIDVYLNGVHLDPSDYTATSGTSIVLGSGAALNDELYVVAFGTFEVASMNADNLSSGTVPIARLGTSGTKNSTTFLRGDNTFAVVDTTNASNLSTGTLPNARLSAVPNSALANSSITINGSAVSLGGSINTGTNWDTTAKTGNFNAAVNNAYFIDTSSSAVTATLPGSANAGEEIRFLDISGTFDTNNLTVGRNSHKIQGDASDLVVSTERAGFALVYVNATQGWLLKDR